MQVDVENQIVEVDYTNWRGIRSTRKILPIRIFFGSNEFHTESQWLLEALDIERQENRTFALKNIHSIS